ncbi:hypothetical protein [Cupriavidus necator]
MDSYSGELLKAQGAYQKKGLKAGEKALPPMTATTFDANETQLVADASRFALQEHARYSRVETQKDKVLADMANELSEVAANCDTLLDDESLNETARNALEHERYALVGLKRKVLFKEAELKAYQIRHGITEEASYPADLRAPYVWLIPFVLAETIANAFFYENTNGLLGGAFVAFMVSLVNIAVSFGLGAAFRYKNLDNAAYKAIGYSVLVAAVIVALFSNALFAAYRTEYQLLVDPSDLKQSSEAFTTAMGAAGHVFLGNIPATDLMSFLLFFAGLVLSVIAFRKGMGVDDPHPGYGARARRLKEAEAALSVVVEGVKAKISKELETKRESLAKAKNLLGQAEASVQKTKAALEQEHRKMMTNLDHVQRDFALVLNGYRQSNVSVRPTAAPEYFAETPDVISQYRSPQSDKLASAIEELTVRIAYLKDTYQAQLTERLRDSANEGRAILGKTLSAFLSEVTAEAKESIEADIVKMPSTIAA